jgi:cobalt/nickel transport system permease protein
MHLPDGFLNVPVAAGMGAASTAVVGVALRKCRSTLDDRAEALLGVTAAGVFAAQMVNFPIPGGTSGHLLGGALAGVILGPWAGLVAITCVLIVQCFLFADGGLLALGANVFNMGVIGCLAGHGIFSLLRPFARTATSQCIAAGAAAWCATILAAAACALQLSLSGSFGFARTLSLMVGVHAVIGVGEAIITAFVLRALLERARMQDHVATTFVQDVQPPPKAVLVGGLALAATFIVVLAPFASSLPDGLERSLSWLGAGEGDAPLLLAWFPDYKIAGLGEWGGTVVAGLVGTAVVTLIAWFASKLAAFDRSAPNAPNP